MTGKDSVFGPLPPATVARLRIPETADAGPQRGSEEPSAAGLGRPAEPSLEADETFVLGLLAALADGRAALGRVRPIFDPHGVVRGFSVLCQGRSYVVQVHRQDVGRL